MNICWGIFSPDEVTSPRRLQTLGLAPAVRHYNDRSVPGLGGLWFGMPIAWALLGIWISEESGLLRPLPCANAVEAAVMRQALGSDSDRARGRRKLPGTSGDFRSLSSRGAYITQPYRMNTVEPLLRLGFVTGSGQRFNLYRLAPRGHTFLDAFEGTKAKLLRWTQGEALPPLPALAPARPLPLNAARLLNRQLRDHGECDRRRTLLDLPRPALDRSPLVQDAPPAGLDPAHWRDLRSGVALVRMRDAALEVLGKIERRIGEMNRSAITREQAGDAATAEIRDLGEAALLMLEQTDSSVGKLGHGFAKLCLQPASKLVVDLAERDGAVIRLLADGRIGLGPAGGSKLTETEETDRLPETDAAQRVPELPRIANLYALAEDLRQSGLQ